MLVRGGRPSNLNARHSDALPPAATHGEAFEAIEPADAFVIVPDAFLPELQVSIGAPQRGCASASARSRVRSAVSSR